MIRYSDEELAEDLARVARKLGRPPTMSDYNTYGVCSASALSNRMGGWSDALEEAGVEPTDAQRSLSKRKCASKDEIASEVRDLAEKLGRPPMASEYKEQGEYSLNTARSRFGVWERVIEYSGLDVDDYLDACENRTSTRSLLQSIRDLSDELGYPEGHPPTKAEMGRLGPHSSETYKSRFGSWEAAVRKAGFEYDREDSFTRQELLDWIHAYINEIGVVPSSADFRGVNPMPTPQLYRDEFGSWPEAIREAGYTPRGE